MLENTSEVLVLATRSPGVLDVELHRPEKLNAFDVTLKRDLADVVARAAADEDVRIVVLRGSGRAFSVGADVGRTPPTEAGGAGGYATAARSAAADYTILTEGTVEAFLAIWRSPVPVVAQVHGYCMGIANILAACCDLVVCAEDTVFGWPAAPLGGGMIGATWAHFVGAHKAKELSYTVGARLSGVEAERLGFANHAVPADRLADRVDELTAHMARLSKDLLRIKKAAVNSVQSRQGFEETVRLSAAWDALAHESDVVAEARTAIGRTGLKATLDDWRPPTWEPSA